MAFAQINYSQKLGNGPYSIAAAGCFLTAFSNLLARYGENIDPPALNNFFLADNKYTHDPSEPAGTVDDLYWGAISAYDGHIIPVGTGGAGWPDSNDAIVKFVYKGPRTGAAITHFCLVANAAAHQIIDSYDGVTKVSPYGTPVAWCKYERHEPQAVTPPPPPAAPAFSVEKIDHREEQLKINTHLWDLNRRSWPELVNHPIGNADAGATFKTSAIAHHILGGSYYLPDGSNDQGYNVVDCENYVEPPTPPTPPPPASSLPQGALSLPSNRPYTVLVPIKGYSTATQAGAGNEKDAKVDLSPGNYFIFNTYPNNSKLINITKKDGSPGAWINTDTNVKPPEPTPPVAETAPPEPPKPEPAPHIETPPAASTTPGDWRDTYKPFPKPVRYIATRDIRVDDLLAQQPSLNLPEYDPESNDKIGVCLVYGTVNKDGIDYYRLKINTDPNFDFWYCIPKIDAQTHTPLLLVLPTSPNLSPVGKITVARDTLELAKSKLENDIPKFLDDIIPKWFKHKK